MAIAELTDHSPRQPDAAPLIPSANNLILIDNYDSFTWNVYQYLTLEGATVSVYRNDEISMEDLIAKNPTQLVVSPGPGHPITDSGISKDAIVHFAGKIPILGVCMGEQCIYSVFGGTVEKTGEILHGKTSPLCHDGKGIYAGLPQNLPVTRYHSLAGTHPTLPDCLEVSSWVAADAHGGRGVIMGVRHKQFVIEGVQYHPESILTAEGRLMFRNFLHMQGGTWASNSTPQKSSNISSGSEIASDVEAPKTSILERIYQRRRELVALQKETPSQRPSDLQAMYELALSPPLISFVDRLKQSPFSLALLAEVKRASPSKGVISLSACAPSQARTYALSGASVISVLTEPDWFKGSIEDLRAVRSALAAMPNRPAVLRKEFIFDEYQILEARLAGADTVLLIVKMLDVALLTRLYRYSQSLGMEPLVEVNTLAEMEIAVNLGAKVIGVNNRNLTSFEVDMDTTTRLMQIVPKETILLALSGISTPKDVAAYKEAGIGGVLIGEALMRAQNVAHFVTTLLGDDTHADAPPTKRKPMVKICGTRTAAAARAAIEAGADLIGIILVPGRSRLVSQDVAQEISRIVHDTRKPTGDIKVGSRVDHSVASDFFEYAIGNRIANTKRALLVGVFQNQSLEHVLGQVELLDLDIVQLHGSEPTEWASLIPVPVIKAGKPGDVELAARGFHTLPLLDAGSGGSGQKLRSDEVIRFLKADEGLQVMLAGGLTPDNVVESLATLQGYQRQISVVDVSSGVETDGKQDLKKIEAFISAVKQTS